MIAENEGLIDKCVSSFCDAINGSLVRKIINLLNIPQLSDNLSLRDYFQGAEHQDLLFSLQISSFLAVVSQMRYLFGFLFFPFFHCIVV